jgi:hypothetical protein
MTATGDIIHVHLDNNTDPAPAIITAVTETAGQDGKKAVQVQATVFVPGEPVGYFTGPVHATRDAGHRFRTDAPTYAFSGPVKPVKATPTLSE